MTELFLLGIALAWALGCICMYLYLVFSGLMRTEEEYYRARGIQYPPPSNKL